jgi:hypothetical protein
MPVYSSSRNTKPSVYWGFQAPRFNMEKEFMESNDYVNGIDNYVLNPKVPLTIFMFQWKLSEFCFVTCLTKFSLEMPTDCPLSQVYCNN